MWLLNQLGEIYGLIVLIVLGLVALAVPVLIVLALGGS